MTIDVIITIAKIVGIAVGLFSAFVIIGHYLWTTIHEFAHLIAAKLVFGISEWEMKVRPCELNGRKIYSF